MTRRGLLAIGLAGYFLALIVSAPATLLDRSLSHASHGQLRLLQAQGTLWSGSGQIEWRDGSGRSALARRMAWRLKPGPVLLGRLAYAVELEPATAPFLMTVFWSHVELAQVDIHVPASALGLGMPRLVALGLGGGLQLQVPHWSFGPGAGPSTATLRWQAAGSALVPVTPLGDYELRIAGDAATVHATLHTLQGPLQLDGQGRWARGSQASYVATARLPAPLQPQLAPFLRLIAVERSDGSFELRND